MRRPRPCALLAVTWTRRPARASFTRTRRPTASLLSPSRQRSSRPSRPSTKTGCGRRIRFLRVLGPARRDWLGLVRHSVHRAPRTPGVRGRWGQWGSGTDGHEAAGARGSAGSRGVGAPGLTRGRRGLTASRGGHTLIRPSGGGAMSVLLYILFTFVALVAAGVVYDLNRRRRGVP